jgi:uncharacterized short protein YbdD (DUF466 family)
MKKLLTSIFTLLLLFGIGTGAMAATNNLPCSMKDFKEMLPFMQEKHPDLSEKQLKQMHKDCAAQAKKADVTNCPVNNN